MREHGLHRLGIHLGLELVPILESEQRLQTADIPQRLSNLRYMPLDSAIGDSAMKTLGDHLKKTRK